MLCSVEKSRFELLKNDIAPGQAEGHAGIKLQLSEPMPTELP